MDRMGDRLKAYEDKTRIVPGSPIIARLDGKSFHTWTKGLDRPFDHGLSALMNDTTLFLARETNALIGYTQSDEITLTWNPQGDTEVIFGGKVQKMVSVLASMCTQYFNSNWIKNSHITSSFLHGRPAGERVKPAYFDCRVYQVPDTSEGANVFLWRRLDCVKNSISMAAQSHFSEKQLHKKDSDTKLQMLSDIGIDWENYPQSFKLGSYVKGTRVERRFTADEIDKLPAKHQAHTNPDLMVERLEYDLALPEGNWEDWLYGASDR